MFTVPLFWVLLDNHRLSVQNVKDAAPRRGLQVWKCDRTEKG